MTSAALGGLVPASADELVSPEAITGRVKAVGFFVPVHLVHALTSGNRLVTRATGLTSARPRPNKSGPRGRERAGIEAHSQFFGEPGVYAFHGRLDENCNLARQNSASKILSTGATLVAIPAGAAHGTPV